jgi:hypothetical protein
MNREIMAITRFSKVPGGVGIYGGEVANQLTLKFENTKQQCFFKNSYTN